MDKKEYSFYFVGTPIGNFDEMTYRAVNILNTVDEIWCEDTIHSRPLLQHFSINKPTQSFHKFSDDKKLELLISKLNSGKKIAYISDAGMPCISDPGYAIIKALIDNNIEYTVISGACAGINALLLSGLNTDNFCFVGFLKPKVKDREKQIQNVINLDCTLIFYSSVHDIKKDIEYLFNKLGDRQCAIVREMTKLYETVVRGKLSDIQLDCERGEYVIVIEGVNAKKLDIAMEDFLKLQLEIMDANDAIKTTAKEYKLPKNKVYQLYINKFKTK